VSKNRILYDFLGNSIDPQKGAEKGVFLAQLATKQKRVFLRFFACFLRFGPKNDVFSRFFVFLPILRLKWLKSIHL